MTLGLNTRTSGTGRRGCWRKYSPLCSPKATSSPSTAPKDLGCSLCVLLLLFVFFSSPPSLPPSPLEILDAIDAVVTKTKVRSSSSFCEVWRMFCFWPVKESATQFFCFVLFFEALLLRIHSLIIRLRPNEMFLRKPWERFFFSLLCNFFFFPRPRHIKL